MLLLIKWQLSSGGIKMSSWQCYLFLTLNHNKFCTIKSNELTYLRGRRDVKDTLNYESAMAPGQPSPSHRLCVLLPHWDCRGGMAWQQVWRPSQWKLANSALKCSLHRESELACPKSQSECHGWDLDLLPGLGWQSAGGLSTPCCPHPLLVPIIYQPNSKFWMELSPPHRW
jgi:hypothetical protein